MAIKDLQPRTGNINLELTVIDKEEPKEFEKFGKKGRLCNLKVKDESGSLKMTLWNDDIDKVTTGNKIKLINGYVNEWQNEMQLTTGKFGSIEVLEEETPEPTEEPEEQTEEPTKTQEESDSIEEDVVEETVEEK